MDWRHQSLPSLLHPLQILRQRQQFNALLADKAFDANWLLEDLHERGAGAVIPPKANQKYQRDYDREVTNGDIWSKITS